MKLNRKQTIYLGVVFVVSLSLAACAGFDWGDVVQTNVPAKVQATHGLPQRLSLNESEEHYADWLDETQTTGVRWKNSIEHANQVRNMLSQLTLHALDQVGPTLVGFPVGSAILPLLAALIGVGIRRPGDISKADLAKQKQDSYNKALEVGASLTDNKPSA